MRIISKLAACTMLAGVAMAGIAVAQDKPTIVTVVKVTGENWFTRMNEGVDAFGKDNADVSASQVGPAKADAAQQARILEDLVAKTCVLPLYRWTHRHLKACCVVLPSVASRSSHTKVTA